MTFRIFVNDRSKTLYSALMPITAADPATAVRIAKRKDPPLRQRYGLETYKAIEWPPKLPASKRWLDVHVGKGL